MKIENISQYDLYYTRNACWIVTFLNILKYSYWILIEPSFLVKVCIYAEKIWIWSETKWATFSILYAWLTKYLNNKLNLNFKVVTTQINKLKQDDKKSYWVWVIWYWTKKWNRIKEDWVITKEDIDYLATFTWGIGHNLLWDWDMWWVMIDTDWTWVIKFPLELLKYAERKWILYSNIRTIIPNDDRTEKIIHFTKQMLKAESKWRLKEYCVMNKLQPYFKEAEKLYFYWRKKKTRN